MQPHAGCVRILEKQTRRLFLGLGTGPGEDIVLPGEDISVILLPHEFIFKQWFPQGCVVFGLFVGVYESPKKEPF